MSRYLVALTIVSTSVAALALVTCAGLALASAMLESGEDRPGGDATSKGGVSTSDAFSFPSGNIPFERELDFKVGNGLFRKFWVSSPSSTKASDGLGPVFNARACQSCHLKDGRGAPPGSNALADRSPSMFLRLSIPGPNGVSLPEPNYGGQLQEFATPGVPPEGRMQIDYTEETVTLFGGETVSLRRPRYRAIELGYGPFHPEVRLSPRLTPPMIGLGLLEAIPEADIRAQADPEDRNGDGVSGRVSEPVAGGPIGRFGWKAATPTVLAQSGEAFAGDIGIGNAVAPHVAGDCTRTQLVCRVAPHGASERTPDREISDAMLDLVAFYARNLAVPPRRNPDTPDVLAGKALFNTIGCAQCHTPRFRTGPNSPDPHLREQTIWPYTDLLLHDMGEDLADGHREGSASGSEWRTPPLWGLGLTGTVNGNTFYLHDGRARSLTEAILWHGGEGKRSREAFAALTAADRARLLAFLESL